MFTFPRSSQNTRWEGQSALFGGPIPYFGGGGLGVCFGFSTLWVKVGAPFDCVGALQARKEAVSEAQEGLTASMKLGVLMAVGITAEMIIERNTSRETSYVDGVASPHHARYHSKAKTLQPLASSISANPGDLATSSVSNAR